MPTGNLSIEQLIGVFSTLPVDLTFVDADDRVAFFSEGRRRIFARSRGKGRQDVAEFWIQFTGRFVHIRYFAVRDGAGQYLGTLEVTQDAGHIRALEGERRLLEYDAAAVNRFSMCRPIPPRWRCARL